jgi:hypothetical protein
MSSENYINHVGLVVDRSASMSHLAPDVVKAVDGLTNHLALRSKEWDQETRITEYIFNDSPTCIHYDKDVLRLPSLAGSYVPSGNTALLNATAKAIEDMMRTPELYGDHAHILYVLTDGQENSSGYKAPYTQPHQLNSLLAKLPNNWTVAVLVPDQQAVFEAKKYGFPPDNISIWDSTSARGVIEAGEVIRRSTENFMQARTKGHRSFKNIFQIDVSQLTPAIVSQRLIKLLKHEYDLFDVEFTDWPISSFVEHKTGYPYRKGSTFYQITKPEKVQAYKQVYLLDTRTGYVFGGPEARRLIGLPDSDEKVYPADHPTYDIFIQSTSVNRKLVPGTKVLVLR